MMRSHPSYLAFLIHRVSGLCLALFIPVHLYFISLLLDDPERLDQFLTWTSTPLVKFSETILIFFAAVHLTGGIRIIVYEWFAANAKQGPWIVATIIIAFVFGIVFLTSSSL